MKRKILNTLGMAAIFCMALSGASQAVELDLAIKGVNLPAWSTKGECVAQFPSGDCRMVFSGDECGEIYTTKRLDEVLAGAVREGQTVTVHTMKNDRFDKLICGISLK